MPGAVEGLRVIDLTRQMAGPHATATLSDFGADVIKVETLPFGDPSRRTGSDFIDGESALYLMWNRGKRSIAVDLRTREGVDLVRRLSSDADVVVENFRPGVADDIGIGYSDLGSDNPRLIYCSISGFGPIGPMSSYPATDPVIQAMSGVMSVTGPADGDPVLAGIPIADLTGALLAVQGILFALQARERTGRGQKVDVSLLFGLVSGLSTRLATYWTTGEQPARFGSAHSVVVPYQTFRTADGYGMAGVWGAGDWPRFCAAVGMPELAEDPRFADNVARLENREALIEILGGVFPTRSTDEWAERFRAERALFGPVLEFPDLFEHPHVQAADIVTSVEHATLGPVRQLRPPIVMSDTPGSVQSAPPILGQHTEQVLGELGLTSDEIVSLVRRGVVALASQRPATAVSGLAPRSDSPHLHESDRQDE